MKVERCAYLTLVLVLAVIVVLLARTRVVSSIAVPICNSSWATKFESGAETSTIPYTIVQSWTCVATVPSRVLQTLTEFAPEYDHVFFDDRSCLRFMNENFHSIVPVYENLEKGAHRADLFRYCYLYAHGGVWLDVKTILIRPLSEIFTRRDEMYTVRSIIDADGKTCYQGILAVPPKSAFMRDMIASFVLAAPRLRETGYLTFCRQMHRYLEINYKTCVIGRNVSDRLAPMNLMQEYDKTFCPTKRDRYGFCTFVRRADGKDVFKIRDHAFPFVA